MARIAHKHLAAFADSRDEEAFARVVEEFGGLVFSSALRRTGDFQLSEEVAQNVFAITAKKANKLAVHPSRTAWFYATTRFEAAKAVQSQRRHHRKMKALACELKTNMNTADEQNWRDALPLLDGYLDRLDAAERDTLFGRFFEGHTFKELAKQSGSTEAACKMRLKRSLGKLRTWLSGRGVTLSVAGLTAGLAAELSQAAPAKVAMSLTSKSLAATSSVSGATILNNILLTMSTTKSLIIGGITALAIFAIPLVLQQSQLGALEKKLAAIDDFQPPPSQPELEEPIAVVEEAGPVEPKVVPARAEDPETPEGLSALEKLEKLHAIGGSGLGGEHPRMLAALGILDGTPPAELFAACRAAGDPKKRWLLANYTVTYLAASHPIECLEFLREEPDDPRSRLVIGFFRNWGKKALPDAVDWMVENQSNEGSLLANLEARNSIIGRLGFTLHRKGGAPAELAFAERLVGRQQQEMVLNGMVNHVREPELKNFATELLSMTDDSSIRGIVFERIARRLTKNDLAAAKEWALGLRDGGEATVYEAAVEGVASSWIRSDPRAAADWWLSHSEPDQREQIYSDIVDEWAMVEPNACGKWLGGQAANQPLDLARAKFARAVFEEDPASAKSWAEAIEDLAMRQTVLRELR